MARSSTYKELQQHAKKIGIKGYSRLNKTELELAIHKVHLREFKALKAKAKRTVAIPTTVEEAGQTFARLDKGNTRKLRKLLRRQGRADLASVRIEDYRVPGS